MAHPSIETIVANMGVPPYPIPKADQDKLASIKINNLKPDDPIWLLLAYAFDAERKLLYFTKAALPILERADPTFRRRVLKDSEEINRPANWEGRARKAHDIMLQLQKEIGEDLEHLRGELAPA